MLSVAFIANIVVLVIGGLLLLVGILLLGFGIVELLKTRRSPDSASPSYSAPVDYPAEAGMDEDFEDAPRWAGGIAVEPDASSVDADVDVDVDADAGASAESGPDSGQAKNTRIKNGREKSLIAVGALLVLLSIFILLNSIVMLA